ncbi:MAG: BolA family protein [Gammaproteobacteria bacterium]
MTSARVDKISACLKQHFSPTFLEVEDQGHLHIGHPGAQTGAGHFKVAIASPVFENKNRLACHRLIYEALGELMQSDIHALIIEIRSS